MAWDSLVRTKQLNQPELSGYIVNVLLQYLKTGTVTGIALNTGQLTGQFYPLSQNPASYVTTGQLTGYATQLQVTGNNIAVLSYVDSNYYPRSNPTGYIGTGYLSTGLLPRSGASFGQNQSFQIYDSVDNRAAIDFQGNNHFILNDTNGNAWISFYPYYGGSPAISGFNIWTTGINGYPALDSGSINNLYVSWNYFTEAKGLTLPYINLDNTKPQFFSSPALTFQSGVFVIVGARSSAASEKYFIDMLGQSAATFGMSYSRPTLYGLDINTTNISATGFPVLTKDDLNSIASNASLLTASGTLSNANNQLRYDLMSLLTGSGASGIYSFTGIGTVVVIQSGLNVIISGISLGSTGQFITTAQTGQFAPAGMTGQFVVKGNTGFFVDNSQITGKQLITSAGTVLDWSIARTYDAMHDWSLDWNARQLSDDGTNASVDWTAHNMYAAGGGPVTVNWSNRQLSGNWSVQNLKISGSTVTTAAGTGKFVNTDGLQSIIGKKNFAAVDIQLLTISGAPLARGRFGSLQWNSGNVPQGASGLYFDNTKLGIGYSTGANLRGPLDFLYVAGDLPLITGITYMPDIGGCYTATGIKYKVYSYKIIDGQNFYSSGAYTDTGFYVVGSNKSVDLQWNAVSGVDGYKIVGVSGNTGSYETQTFGFTDDCTTMRMFTGLQPQYARITDVYIDKMSNLFTTGSIYVSGNIYVKGSAVATANQTGQFVDSSDTGNFVTNGQTGILALINVSGANIGGLIYLTGVGGTNVTLSGNSVLISGGGGTVNTGSFITSGQTGLFAPELIGLPTDGAYGGVNGAIAGIAQGDRHEDAFDKIEVIFGKLAPSKPPNLSAQAFVFTGVTYNAFMQGTQTIFSNVMNNLKPTGFSTGFYDGDNGILSGYINNTLTGIRTLWTGLDTGNYSGLVIYNEYDFWAGTVGKAGFWTALNAKITPMTTLTTGIVIMRMGHSTSGPTSGITGYCDAPLSATSVCTSTGTGIGMCNFRYIDGVISFTNGDSVFTKLTTSNAICAFYTSPMAQLNSAALSTTNIASTGSPTSGATMFLSGYQTVNNATYSTGFNITVSTFNSANISTSLVIPTNFRVDTNSNQQAQRHTAGVGRFPTSNYNLNYDNTINLSGNEELQMINSAIQNPPAVNYGVLIPSGANYQYIQTGTYSGCRWAMYDMGNFTSASNIQLTFNGATNFGASTITPNMLMDGLMVILLMVA